MQSVLNRQEEGKMENRNGKLIASTKGFRVSIVFGFIAVIGIAAFAIWVLSDPVSFGKTLTKKLSEAQSIGTWVGIIALVLSAAFAGTLANMARSYLNVYENGIEGVSVKEALGGKYYYGTEKFSFPYSKISTVSEEGKVGEKNIIIRTKDGAAYKIASPKNYKNTLEAIRSRISDD